MGALLSGLRGPIIAAGCFSLLANLLAFVPSLFMLQVYDRVLTSRSLETLAMLGLIVTGTLLAWALLDHLRSRLLQSTGARLEAAAGGVLLRELVRQAAAAGVRPAAQPLRDLRQLRQFMASPVLGSLFDLPWAPAFMLLIALFHPLLGAVALVGVAVLAVLAWLEHRLIAAGTEAAAEAGRRAAEIVDGTTAGIDTVHSMGMTATLEARWRAASAVADARSMTVARRSGRVLAASKFTRQALQSLMLALGAWLVIRQQASPGVMIAATLLLGRAMSPVESTISGWRSLLEARAAWRRLDPVLAGRAARGTPMALPTPRGAVQVERLVFGPDPAQPLIRNVSVTLAPGEQLGLIGPSGAGKSTLGRLLLGLLTPRSGLVRLDGADIRGWDPDRLGPSLGYLPQEVHLFDGTVAENIARMQPPAARATAVIEAARSAGVHELILRLPDGYDTRVGPRGQPLSAGQRQRIGLARAMFGRPTFVVLDEPNSNLDTEGEAALVRALATLKAQGTTVVLITHRPALLAQADQVMVLTAGGVAELGPRADVLGRFTRGGLPPTLVSATSGARAVGAMPGGGGGHGSGSGTDAVTRGGTDIGTGTGTGTGGPA